MISQKKENVWSSKQVVPSTLLLKFPCKYKKKNGDIGRREERSKERMRVEEKEEGKKGEQRPT